MKDQTESDMREMTTKINLLADQVRENKIKGCTYIKPFIVIVWEETIAYSTNYFNYIICIHGTVQGNIEHALTHYSSTIGRKKKAQDKEASRTLYRYQ